MNTTMLTQKAPLRQMTARSLFGFLGLAMLTLGQAAPATAQVTITQVFVDFPAPDQVTIDGQDFDNGPNLVVTLGDIAIPLVFVVPPTPNRIIADLPAGLVAGDYLLTVTTGGGPNRQDDYDLTIGAAGPVGGTLTGPAHRHTLEPWDQTVAPVDDNSGGTDFNARTGEAGGGAMGGATALADGRPPFMTILLCRRIP